MPIYREEKHSYPKLRVAVGVNGKLRQKYFSLKNVSDNEINAIYQAAEAIETKWKIESKAGQAKRVLKAKPTERSSEIYRTGVKGIQFKWTRRTVKGNVHYRPGFYVGIAECNKHYGVLKAGHKAGWTQAIKTYCECKGIEINKSLMRRIPSKKKWQEVREHYNCKLGWDIPETEISK